MVLFSSFLFPTNLWLVLVDAAITWIKNFCGSIILLVIHSQEHCWNSHEMSNVEIMLFKCDCLSLIYVAVPWWEQKVDSSNIGQSKPWKTCWVCPVSSHSLSTYFYKLEWWIWPVGHVWVTHFVCIAIFMVSVVWSFKWHWIVIFGDHWVAGCPCLLGGSISE